MLGKVEELSNELNEKMSEFRAKVQTEGQGELVKAFKKIFEDNPAIKGIRWNQYTPYFNDGEPCEFGLNEVYFNLDLKAIDSTIEVCENGGDYDDGWLSPWDLKYYYESLEHHPIRNIMEQIDSAIQNSVDAMEIIFGDHVHVEVTPKGIEVSDYDHY